MRRRRLSSNCYSLQGHISDGNDRTDINSLGIHSVASGHRLEKTGKEVGRTQRLDHAHAPHNQKQLRNSLWKGDA